MCGKYIINGIHAPEPKSSGENTSSNPQVSALIPRPAFNGMERMCHRHGSNANSHPPVLVRKPLCNQFIHYHISSRSFFSQSFQSSAVNSIGIFLDIRWRSAWNQKRCINMNCSRCVSYNYTDGITFPKQTLISIEKRSTGFGSYPNVVLTERQQSEIRHTLIFTSKLGRDYARWRKTEINNEIYLACFRSVNYLYKAREVIPTEIVGSLSRVSK